LNHIQERTAAPPSKKNPPFKPNEAVSTGKYPSSTHQQSENRRVPEPGDTTPYYPRNNSPLGNPEISSGRIISEIRMYINLTGRMSAWIEIAQFFPEHRN
jgi:hypothetical protein